MAARRVDCRGNFPIHIEQTRKPNYGSSPQKEEMIAAADAYLDILLCEDLISGDEGDAWVGATAYLADFYEYGDSASAWVIRKDGLVYHSPVMFSMEEDEVKAAGIKGFEIEDMASLDINDSVRFEYDLGIRDAVRTVSCANGG